MEWQLVLRRAAQEPARPLPRSIVTAGPGFRQDGWPDEVGLLLPNGDGARGLLDGLPERPEALSGRALGLFLADPFLHLPLELARLRAAGVEWLANLPSVGQLDAEFLQQLGDVGLDLALEHERLALLAREGFGIVAVAAGAEAAGRSVALDPCAMVVLPRVADFAAGFPSFRQRGAAVREVAEAARSRGWRGPVLGLAAESEVAHETLWPDVLDGVVTRPTAVTLVVQPSSCEPINN